MENNLLCSDELSQELRSSFDRAEHITILSAFLTMPAVDFLFESAPLGVDIEVVCRARPQDLVAGACDLHAIRVLHFSGVKCYISRDLHAKLYVIDHEKGFIGSANFTSNGLRLSGYGNLELSTRVQLSQTDKQTIRHIKQDAILIDAEVLKRLEEYINGIETNVECHSDLWWEDVIELAQYHCDDGLYVHDLPWCHLNMSNTKEAIEHDNDVFGVDLSEDQTLRFKRSKVYQFLLQKFEHEELEEAYFGKVTEWVHSSLKDDTVPYRSEVKDYIANLYSYLEHYGKQDFSVDRPNHSQRIRLITHE